MLNLKLRNEFLGSQMPGTAIALRRKDNTEAAQRDPDFILSITYPTADVQTALRAVGANRPRRPIVLMGERGRGKSHIMAVMHHAVDASDQVQAWANEWGSRLASQALSDLTLESGFVAISEPVHNHEYPLLWDLIFDRHPRGDFFKGKFNQMAHPFPPRSLLEEMFEAQPVALILDEFQKWFDGLSDQPGPEGIKYRTWAENFIQNLSEISKDRPEILMLVISVLNNNTEAFRQVHRDGPVIIDFRGPTAKEDRKKLLLYRLFENRENIPSDEIHGLKKLPDQICKAAASTTLQDDGFWKFVDRLRQGRRLVVTSDHGHHIIMGQRKWKVQGGFPHVCHGGLSLLEVAVPFIELPPL